MSNLKLRMVSDIMFRFAMFFFRLFNGVVFRWYSDHDPVKDQEKYAPFWLLRFVRVFEQLLTDVCHSTTRVYIGLLPR